MLGTDQKKSEETAGITLFGSRPRDPIFEFIEEGSIEEENERISKDVKKLTKEDLSEQVSDDDDKGDEGKQDNRNKTREEPQKSGPVESENLINIADDTEIFDLTKKTEGGSRSGVKKEEKEGGLITTWKEIRTAAGALPQKIRTIIVPLHKVLFNESNLQKV